MTAHTHPQHYYATRTPGRSGPGSGGGGNQPSIGIGQLPRLIHRPVELSPALRLLLRPVYRYPATAFRPIHGGRPLDDRLLAVGGAQAVARLTDARYAQITTRTS